LKRVLGEKRVEGVEVVGRARRVTLHQVVEPAKTKAEERDESFISLRFSSGCTFPHGIKNLKYNYLVQEMLFFQKVLNLT